MKRRIVFYIAGLQRGGAERVLADLANFFVHNDYDVTVFTDCLLEKEYYLEPGIRREVVGYEPTGKRLTDMVKRITTIRKAYLRVKPDVVVSFIGKTNIRAVLASFGTGIPVIVSVRSGPQREYYSAAMKILAKCLFGFAAGTVFQTEGAKDWFGKRVQKKSVILANPLHDSVIRFRYDGARADEIVAVGRLVEVKNYRLLLKAFAQIADKYPGTVLKICGDGPERENLLQYVKELAIDSRVLFMGDCDNVPDAIYRSRLFVLSSDVEGMPNALLEAMSMGLAVISTDCPCGGPRAVIQNGQNGILVPVGDDAALAEAIDRVLSNPGLEESLGKNAHKIQERLSPEKVNEQWREYIESVMRQ